jgi:hypothetical protein
MLSYQLLRLSIICFNWYDHHEITKEMIVEYCDVCPRNSCIVTDKTTKYLILACAVLTVFVSMSSSIFYEIMKTKQSYRYVLLVRMINAICECLKPLVQQN